jgi:hypothetical protein
VCSSSNTARQVCATSFGLPDPASRCQQARVHLLYVIKVGRLPRRASFSRVSSSRLPSGARHSPLAGGGRTPVPASFPHVALQVRPSRGSCACSGEEREVEHWRHTTSPESRGSPSCTAALLVARVANDARSFKPRGLGRGSRRPAPAPRAMPAWRHRSRPVRTLRARGQQ